MAFFAFGTGRCIARAGAKPHGVVCRRGRGDGVGEAVAGDAGPDPPPRRRRGVPGEKA